MIHFEKISKSYGETQAVKDISFHVESNELFGLIGPDGAGKTTLMRILVSLLLPDNGIVTMDNRDVTTEFRTIRQMVGYMPGRFSLYQDLSVEENLNFFASVFGTTIHANYHLIEGIYKQIEPFKKRRAGKLSGGMKQKLALSCALIHKPKVLVLDEPTTGVDAVSRKEFWEMLVRLKEEGITIIVSTPYMDEASLCDRVALIQQGRILSIDTPQNIVDKYGNPIWMIRSGNTFKLLTDLKKWDKTHTVYPFGQYMHLTPAVENLDEVELRVYLEKCGNDGVEIKRGNAGIEDIFMKLMGSAKEKINRSKV